MPLLLTSLVNFWLLSIDCSPCKKSNLQRQCTFTLSFFLKFFRFILISATTKKWPQVIIENKVFTL